DGAARHFPVGEIGSPLRWVGDALWLYGRDGWHRLDPATGTWSDGAPEPARELSACAERGMRLKVDRGGGRQRLVLEAAPRPDAPDHIATLGGRVLVIATDRPHDQHFDTHRGDFGVTRFAASCDYFVFSFGESIYVGNVATGEFAYLTAGTFPDSR